MIRPPSPRWLADNKTNTHSVWLQCISLSSSLSISRVKWYAEGVEKRVSEKFEQQLGGVKLAAQSGVLRLHCNESAVYDQYQLWSLQYISKSSAFLFCVPEWGTLLPSGLFLRRHLGPEVYKSETLNCVSHVNEFGKKWSIRWWRRQTLYAPLTFSAIDD